MKAKVFWTREEKTILTLETRRLAKEFPHLSMYALVNKAQESLPKERRRGLTTNTSPFVQELHELRQQ